MQLHSRASGSHTLRPGPQAIVLTSFLVLSSCLGAGASHQKIDLPTAIQLALLQNRSLIQSALAVESARYGIRGAQAGFAFRVVPDGSAFASDGPETLSAGLDIAKRFEAGTDAAIGGSFVRIQEAGEEATERASIRLRVTQPLFRNAGPLITREPVVQAERSWLSTRRSLEQQKSTLTLEVVRSYETLVQLNNQIDFDKKFFDRIDSLYRLTRARERQGRTTRVDTLRVELQRGQAASRLLNNRERVRSLYLDFAELLGFSPNTTFELRTPPLVEWTVPATNDAFSVAFSNRLELAQAQQDLDDTERGVKIARRRLLPALDLVARVEPFGEGDALDEILSFNETTWSVALRGNTDLVNQRQRAVVEQRMVDEESSWRRLEIVQDAVQRDVEQSMLAYHRARRELEISRTNLELAGSRVLLARRLFARGRGDSFSVTDAEDAYVQAQRNMLFARAEASFNGYRMLHAMGTLIDFPDDLKPELTRSP
jgi:outer membrane protein TolC